ncbi:MAG TPA: histidine phosphatase family protein [Gaiellaceae bacterium]|nr:histidine phosphatase family protein [Gaiellaceae bacterium]
MAVTSTATTILLVRHGETDWNRDRRIQGHTDVPLNESGREQSRRLAETLAGDSLAAIYSSDLCRAVETASILAARAGLAVRTASGLREKHFGTWEGLTDAVALERFPHVRTGPWGDGETTDAMAARVTAALREIADAHAGETVLVVTHGGPVRAVLRASGVPPDGSIGNCSVTRISVEDGEFRPID